VASICAPPHKKNNQRIRDAIDLEQ